MLRLRHRIAARSSGSAQHDSASRRGCHAERSGEEQSDSPRSRSIATPFRLHPRVLHPAMPDVGMLRLRHRIAARSSGSAQHDSASRRGCHAERSGEEQSDSPRSRSIATPFRLHPWVLHPAMPEVGILRLRSAWH